MAGSPRDDSRPETLADLFDTHGIELNGGFPRPGQNFGGHRTKLVCPACGGGREKERNFFIKVDLDGQGATWCCFRASNCGITGGGRLAGSTRDYVQHHPKAYKRPPPPRSIERPASLIAYFAGFGISEATLQALSIHRANHRMPVLNREGKTLDGLETRPAIVYPYRRDGELLNNKFKGLYVCEDKGERFTKKRFMQEGDAEPSLFNIDSVLPGTKRVFVTEGEDDVAALFECGFRASVTLPNGSPPKLAADYDPNRDSDDRYMPLRAELKLVDVEQIYLAGDMDEAGARHHEEMARRLGKARCWLVRWPEGCKDAKDTLQKRGRDAVSLAVENALPYPLEGVARITEDQLRDLYNGVRSRRFITGMPMIDQRVSLTAEGQLIVTTGIPGHGKSTFWLAMGTLYAEQTEDRMSTDISIRPFHTIVASAEVRPDRVMADLISQRLGAPFFANHSAVPRAGFQNVLDAKPWVERHFTFVQWPERGTQPPMTWVMQRFEELAMRTGAKLGIVDPWQEYDDERPAHDQDTGSKWIGKVLQRWLGLAIRLGMNIVIIVHPAKMRRDRDGEFAIPTGYDIQDSQNFSSRTDIGLTIHRPDDEGSDMLIKTWKAKDRRFAQIGDTTARLDLLTTRIHPKPVDIDALDPAQQHWQEGNA